MSIYADLDEDQLIAKIDELRAALEKVAMGGGITRVAGEGRMMEFSQVNVATLQRMLNDAILQLGILRGEDPRQAIRVSF